MERIVAENWGVLMSAPVAFVAALCLGAVAGWIVVGLIYNQRLTHYQELISNYRDVLDEKLPARALRPFPIKRSKQMSFGLVLMFVGIGAALLGAIIVASDRSPSPSPQAPKTASVVSPAIAPAVGAPVLPITPPPSSVREFTDRTPGELLALFEGRTMLQANQLIEPEKGKWIKAHGPISQIIPNGPPGASSIVLRDGNRMINCNIGAEWSARVIKLNSGEIIQIVGKIQPFQNGQQLYLSDCDLVD